MNNIKAHLQSFAFERIVYFDHRNSASQKMRILDVGCKRDLIPALLKMEATISMKYVLYLLLLTSCTSQAQTKKSATNVQHGHMHESKGYVLNKSEGEILNDLRGRKMIIKVSPERGAAHLTMGTTEMPKGTGIFIHRHEHAEEILFVHRGNGFAVIEGDSVAISEGATLYIPPGTWHGVNNPTDSMNILFIVTPQGQEKIFRALAAPPGTWTPVQIDSLRKKVGTYMKPQ